MDQGLANYYARRAAEYEEIYSKPGRQSDLAALCRIVNQAFGGLCVLEVACGTGFWTTRIAESAESILATDINREMIEIARRKPLPAGKVRFRRCDAYGLGALRESFSAGFAGFWWSHVPKARVGEFLAQFARCLEPGAPVLFLDNRYVPGSSTPIARTDEAGNTYQDRRLKDGSRFEVLKNFPTEEELRRACAGTLREVQVGQLTYYWFLFGRRL